jgi:CRISPR-associated protein Csd1
VKDKQHEKLIKATIERLLPCIVDGQPFPRDLVESTVRRASNRVGLDHWEWEKNLGIACALFKGAFKNEEYQMTLEINRHNRDYLYGRLLALAENIESYALTTAEKTRETSAARLMQRFADHPASTWRTIELALSPYKSRLRSTDKGRGFLIKREKLIDEIMGHFSPDDFLSPRSLTGEFLLGYHCQRQILNPPKPTTDSASTTEDSPTE